MSRTEEVILTNMCLIEDGQGQIVMQIRDPERYAGRVQPYQEAISKQVNRCMRQSCAKCLKKQV